MAKKFIFGLGNPGEEYKNSRHNAGFTLAENIAEKYHAKWRFDSAFRAEIAEVPEQQLLLVKPQTFMNESGFSVRSVVGYYDKELQEKLDRRMELREVYVMYDDLDLELGQYKMQFGKHPRIHNGVNSIIETLKTDQFWNIRIGTDTRAGDRSQQGSDFVLMPFNAEERARLVNVMENVVQELHASIVSS